MRKKRLQKMTVTILSFFLFVLMLSSYVFASNVYVNGDAYEPGIHGVTIEGDTTASTGVTIPCQATNGVGKLWYKPFSRAADIVIHVFFTWLIKADAAVETCAY